MVQSVAYFAGFETGDGSETSGLAANFSVQTTTKRTGGYALQGTANANEGVQLVALTGTQFAIRLYLQFTGTPDASGVVVLLFDGAKQARLYLNAAKKLVARDSASVETTGTKVFSASTWYRIEMLYNAASGGIFKVYYDGTLDINTTETGGLLSATPFAQVYNDAVGGATYYWDDIRIDTGGLALVGAGQCIARQGVAGTPTYDAWTKNGAATAALCWSDTPFSTATNCTDNVLNDAQTMLVGKFSTAGSAAEGTQVVSSDDLINAAKVSMVAKTAVIGNINVRRRVGAANTDTTIALTTSDAYYETALFTDTVANLDAYEIGVTNALIATAETVEDLWLMVDYTPVPVNVPDLNELSIYMPAIRRAPVMIAY